MSDRGVYIILKKTWADVTSLGHVTESHTESVKSSQVNFKKRPQTNR